MASEPILTIVGNTTAPAEIRFTQAGAAVASFTVASTPRTLNKQTNEWVDGETIFMDCSAWREMAENVVDSLSEKGMRVIVQGRLKSQSWDDKQTGQKRSKMVLDVDEIGPALRYATAKVTKVDRRQGGQGQQQGGYGPGGYTGNQGGQGQWNGQGGGQQGGYYPQPNQGQQQGQQPPPQGGQWPGGQQGGFQGAGQWDTPQGYAPPA